MCASSLSMMLLIQTYWLPIIIVFRFLNHFRLIQKMDIDLNVFDKLGKDSLIKHLSMVDVRL